VSGQQWDPEIYAKNASFVPALGADVLALLGPQPGERILDLGCGDGVLTERLVEAGCVVVGVDSSAAQVAAACARGLDARVLAGESLPFEREFDAVFSNAALHWMKQADRVVEGVHRALRPGGRFVAEMGGAGNCETIQRALYVALARCGVDAATVDPWFFPAPEFYRGLLERKGFEVVSMALMPRPTPLPTGMEGNLEAFAGAFLNIFEPGERARVVADVCDALRPKLYDDEHGWIADYVRLRFAAWIRPETV
jgi:SAM-dependent methyltransferase